jgi:serine phosphatase RsbU (regulator of sigma subunit)
MSSQGSDYRPRYDGSVFKVMILAGVLLVFATTLIGVLSFRITEKEVIHKLKTKDLFWTARSISNQVEGRIERAIETSEMLASDPSVVEWVRGGETDDKLKGFVLNQLVSVPKQFDYTNSFVVSGTTHQYWSESGRVIDTVSKDDPDDDWFFSTMDSGKHLDVVVDTNATYKNTFVFVNVLIGDTDKPLGVAGMGLSLEKLSQEFVTYKYGKDSHLWMVGADGIIHLSDDFKQTGTNISEYMDGNTLAKLDNAGAAAQTILEMKSADGRLIDMISYPIKYMNMRLIVQIPRSETVGFLDSIKWNTALAVVLSLVVIVFFFIYVSRKLADPYKRALRMNQQLEEQVDIRTKELAESNKEVMDSIAYANRIQQSVLPSDSSMKASFDQYFSYWKPRDVVGGDFYWVKKVGNMTWVAVGDCTGHGVPGALMTMLSVTLLNRIADEGGYDSPSAVLGKLNLLLKETLNQLEAEGTTDDGLDLGLIFLGEKETVYAGAGILLALSDAEGIRSIKGDKRKIGYRRTPIGIEYTDHWLSLDRDRVYYLVSDGIFDQNGGEGKPSIGRTRLLEWLGRYQGHDLGEQSELFENELKEYMGREPQRDDMTLLAFKPADLGSSE